MDRRAEMRAERRARRENGTRRLAIDESKLDRSRYEYRWVNDTGTRVQVLTELGDYEVAPEVESKITGTTKEGAHMRTVLMRKPRELYDDDVAARQAEIDAQEATIREAQVGEGTYVPKDTPIEIGGKRSRRAA